MSAVTGEAAKFNAVILISGTGSNMEAVISYSQTHPDCPYRVLKVLSDRSARGIQTARAKGIEALELDRRAADFNERLLEETEGADVIVLAGYLSILDPSFIETYSGRILNIHPSLLPLHGGKGMYGLKVHQAVLDSGETESGCTVHLVTQDVDQGEILLQKKVPVKRGDAAADLRDRILPFEHECLVEGLLLMINKMKERG